MNLIELQAKLDTSKRAFIRDLVIQLNTDCIEVDREYVTYDDDIYQRDLDTPEVDEKVTILASTVLEDGTVTLAIDTETDLIFGVRTEVSMGLSLLKLYIEYNKNLLEMALANETNSVADANALGLNDEAPDSSFDEDVYLNMSSEAIIEAMNIRNLTEWSVDLDKDRVTIEVFHNKAVTIKLNENDFTISDDNTSRNGLSVLDDSVSLGEVEYVHSKIALALHALVTN